MSYKGTSVFVCSISDSTSVSELFVCACDFVHSKHFYYSGLASIEKKEEVWETITADRWYFVYNRVPERMLRECQYKHRGPQGYGLGG